MRHCFTMKTKRAKSMHSCEYGPGQSKKMKITWDFTANPSECSPFVAGRSYQSQFGPRTNLLWSR